MIKMHFPFNLALEPTALRVKGKPIIDEGFLKRVNNFVTVTGGCDAGCHDSTLDSVALGL